MPDHGQDPRDLLIIETDSAGPGKLVLCCDRFSCLVYTCAIVHLVERRKQIREITVASRALPSGHF